MGLLAPPIANPAFWVPVLATLCRAEGKNPPLAQVDPLYSSVLIADAGLPPPIANPAF